MIANYATCLWDKFTLKGNMLNARVSLQKITIGNSLFVVVVFLFITQGGISVCAVISGTHVCMVDLPCPNWGVPKIITLSFCYL